MSCSSDSTSPGLSPHASSGSSPDHSPNKQPAGRRNLLDSGAFDVETIDAVPFPYPPRRNVFIEPGSGMRDVPMWLKGLRLHKYTSLFQQLSYDQMLQLTEQQLDIQGVTKGARHKIVSCVQKLRERTALLSHLEKDIAEPGGVRTALCELRGMAYTPIRPFPPPGRPVGVQALIDGVDVDPSLLDPENLPAHFTRVLGKACHRMLHAWQPGADLHIDAATTLMHIIDRIINHEAFTQAQKRRVISWKQNIKRVWNPPQAHYNPNKYTSNRNSSAAPAPVWQRRSGSSKWGPGEYRGGYDPAQPIHPPFHPQQNPFANIKDAHQLMNMSLSMYQQLMMFMAHSNWANTFANQPTPTDNIIPPPFANNAHMGNGGVHASVQRTSSMPTYETAYGGGECATSANEYRPFADDRTPYSAYHNLLQPILNDEKTDIFTTPHKQEPVARQSKSIPSSPWENTNLLSNATTPLTVNTATYGRDERSTDVSFFNTPSNGSCNDLNVKMDQLCRSMAEQVINGSIDSPNFD